MVSAASKTSEKGNRTPCFGRLPTWYLKGTAFATKIALFLNSGVDLHVGGGFGAGAVA